MKLNDTKLMRLVRRDANRTTRKLTLIKGEDGSFFLTSQNGKSYRIDENSTYLNIDRLKKEIGYKKPERPAQKLKRGTIDLGGDYDD